MLARLLASGKIGARFAGGAEYGPRALGNRSMLADPRPPGMRDYLNDKVKFRETFRPYAPSVLAEHADECSTWAATRTAPTCCASFRCWPTGWSRCRPSPTSTAPPACRPSAARRIPGYYELIQAFHELTGVPMVLNTSFNLAGRPLVETPRHAVECYEATRVDALLLGDWLLTKEPLAQ